MTDEAEWGTDVNLHDNVKGFIRGCVYHFVECESGVVDNVVDFSPFPVTTRLSKLHRCSYELYPLNSRVHDLLREVIRTNITRDRESLPTSSLYFCLHGLQTLSVNTTLYVLAKGSREQKHGLVLADDNFRTLLGEEEGS